jgi:hypothetical protein
MSQCKICGEVFDKPQKVGSHHQLVHGKNRSSFISERKRIRVEEYNKNPILCKHCCIPLSYEESQAGKVFCSRSCSATFNNTRRVKEKKCENCGILFSGAGKKYCSSKCCGLHKSEEKKSKWLTSGSIEQKSTNVNTVRSKYVRSYILSEQNGLCANCSIPEVWKGKPLVFVLDHVDGNYLNNNRENLRLICPNCDSQTDTYKGRNLGNGRVYRRKK